MWRFLFLFLPMAAQACDRPICEVAAGGMFFARTITFDDQPSGFGPGRALSDIIVFRGVSFGERFAGQVTQADGDFDTVIGTPTLPLTIVPGAEAQNLTIIRLPGTNALSGYGPAGFPNYSATGEGAIAVLFDEDQPSLGFDLRGGEGGTATLIFLRRDGTVIDAVTLGPLAEVSYAFVTRDGAPKIAGLIITNQDPDGIALDTLEFEQRDQSS